MVPQSSEAEGGGEGEIAEAVDDVEAVAEAEYLFSNLGPGGLGGKRNRSPAELRHGGSGNAHAKHEEA